jgi:hypothetical protein
MNMTSRSRDTVRPSFAINVQRDPQARARATLKGGRRECRVSDAPVAAQNAVVFHRFTGLNRHSLRDGFTVSFVLSPVTGLFCHRRP